MVVIHSGRVGPFLLSIWYLLRVSILHSEILRKDYLLSVDLWTLTYFNIHLKSNVLVRHVSFDCRTQWQPELGEVDVWPGCLTGIPLVVLPVCRGRAYRQARKVRNQHHFTKYDNCNLLNIIPTLGLKIREKT